MALSERTRSSRACGRYCRRRFETFSRGRRCPRRLVEAVGGAESPARGRRWLPAQPLRLDSPGLLAAPPTARWGQSTAPRAEQEDPPRAAGRAAEGRVDLVVCDLLGLLRGQRRRLEERVVAVALSLAALSLAQLELVVVVFPRGLDVGVHRPQAGLEGLDHLLALLGPGGARVIVSPCWPGIGAHGI
eukprot:scaffold50_cov162-Ochromonas_danica.AAC.5